MTIHSHAPDPRLRVDVVIPVHDDERALEPSVSTLRDFLLQNGRAWRWRIVIADNASVDRSFAIAQTLADRWPGEVTAIHLDEKGKGRALRRAWTDTDAHVSCYVDVGLSTDLASFPAIVDALILGYDVAYGSRLASGARVRRGLKREIISRCYNALIHLLFASRVEDAQCEFKGISRCAADEILPLVLDEDWFFDTELLLTAEKNGYHLKEIPVSWKETSDRPAAMHRIAWEGFKGLWRLNRGFRRRHTCSELRGEVGEG